MNAATIQALNQMTRDFYTSQCNSFAQTRMAPWPGWERCAQLFANGRAQASTPATVLDLACGNLRFERFLAHALPETSLTFYAIDNCNELAEQADAYGIDDLHFLNLDILEALGNETLQSATCSPKHSPLLGCAVPPCDLSVCFGFMHHIPTQQLRLRVIQALIGNTAPGALIALSFWQFMNDAGLAAKAHATHERALQELAAQPETQFATSHVAFNPRELEEGDFLLGWQEVQGVYRYCHHFATQEIDELVAHIADTTTVVERFNADGRTGDLNAYLILRTT